MQPTDSSAENLIATVNGVFVTHCSRLSASREVQLNGRLHIEICNVPLYLQPAVRLQIRLTKARPGFYVMKKSVHSQTIFKFLDAQLLLRRVGPNTAFLLAHNSTLSKVSLERYNLTKVELKTFTFSAGSK